MFLSSTSSFHFSSSLFFFFLFVYDNVSKKVSRDFVTKVFTIVIASEEIDCFIDTVVLVKGKKKSKKQKFGSILRNYCYVDNGVKRGWGK